MLPLFLLPLLLRLAPAPAPGGPAAGIRYQGIFSNGMKGDTISFVLAPDGKAISQLTFKGYWRCAGKLQPLASAGPQGTYAVAQGSMAGRLCADAQPGGPGNCFELRGKVNGAAASGQLRLTNAARHCDSGWLLWSAVATKPTK